MSISGNYSNPYSSYTSGLGSTSSASSAGTSDVKFSNGYTSTSEAGGGEKKSGGIGGFFKGIWNGAKNAVKSLMTPKGLLMAAAGLAACIAFPVAAPLVLGGIAVAAGGSKMYSAAKNHDAEGVGEGFFTAGSGAAGIWGSGAIGAARAGGSGAAAEGAGSTSSSFLSKLNPLNWFKSSKPAPTAEPPASIPPAPQFTTQNAPAVPPRSTASTAAPVETVVPEATVNAPGRSMPGAFPGSPTLPAEAVAPRSMPGAFPGSPTVPGENLASTTTHTATNTARTGTTTGETTTPATTSTATQTTAPTTAATTEGAATTAEGAATTASKPAMFQGARNNVTGAYQYIKNPFTGPMPEGATAPGMFARTGQVLTGSAPGMVGKPIWSLPSTTAISGNGLSQEQMVG